MQVFVPGATSTPSVGADLEAIDAVSRGQTITVDGAAVTILQRLPAWTPVP